MVLGVLLIHLRFPSQLRWLLIAACGLSLIVPAKHVVSNWTESIQAFPVEIARARQPLPVPDSDYDAALSDAISLFKLGRLPEALSSADRAVQLHPDRPEALYNRAVIRAASGDFGGATSDVTEVLRVAPGDWYGRSEAEGFLAALRARTAGK
jgi:tetratricopeptide (TPR) repeat protein